MAETFEEPTFEMGRKKAKALETVPILPKGDRILVIRNSYRQKGRIIVPDTAQQAPTTGRVVAFGPDVPDGFVELNEQIVFSRYSGIPYAIVDNDGNVTEFVSLQPGEIAGTLLIDVDKLKLEQPS
jgi:co-chaperonin GroES (HSP10)